MAVMVSLTLVAATTAGADQIEDKRAEAAAIAAKLDDQADRIVALDVQYRRAQDELEDAQAAVAQAEADVAATTRRQDEMKRALIVQAQDAYVVGGSVSVLRYLIRSNKGDEVARRAYLRIVTGQDRQIIGQLRAIREDQQEMRDRLQAARRRARDKADAIAGDRGALDRAIRSQRAVLAEVSGELSSLVAAEQARRDAEQARRDAEQARQAAARQAAAPKTAATPVVPIASKSPVNDTFACIRQLESGNNYGTPGGGAYQFLDSTWQALGYAGTASDAPPAVQDEAARKLQASEGWTPWTTAPLCGRA